MVAVLAIASALAGWAAGPREIEVGLPQAGVRVAVLWGQPRAREARPLCVVLPGGSGAREQAELTWRALAEPLLARGWIVAVPISPRDREFFQPERVRLVPELVERLKGRKGVAAAPVLLGGLSNGGGAALLVAGLNPGRFAAVFAVPGFFLPQNEQALALGGLPALAPGLRDLPVLLRTGENDQLGWARQVHPASVEALVAAGAKVDARIVPGAGHVLPIDPAELDAFLGAAGLAPSAVP